LANLATFTQSLVNYTKGNKKTKKGLILSSTKKEGKNGF
jgi:co-chaperonin GroES (HSP10)